MKVGLIGRGRLGKLIEHYLSQDVDLLIYEENPQKQSPQYNGSLIDVCKRPIVIAAVQISALSELLTTISPHLAKGTLFIDVCSVKQRPMQEMKTYLPEHVQILGTHPMFGPDSAAHTLFGSKIVLCRERVEENLYQNIMRYLEGVGLNVIETDPKEHDRQISHSLLITHLIGRTLMEFNAKPLQIDTKGYRRLMKILSVVENDSFELFQDMMNQNPEAKETIESFQNAMNRVMKKAKAR
jgi:prephenate dehydrogenase